VADVRGMKELGLSTTMYMCVAPQDVVSSPKRRTAAIGHFTEHKAGTMQDPANGFRRIPLPRTPVIRARRRAKAATPRPSPSRYVALTFRRDTTTVRRDGGGLLNARQDAIIIGLGGLLAPFGQERIAQPGNS
jgi:hypothetical protein